MAAGLAALPTAEPLHGSPFGIELKGVTTSALRSDPAAQAAEPVRAAFHSCGGLLIMKFDPDDFAGADMVAVSTLLGRAEAAPADGTYERCLPDAPEVHEFAKVPSARVFEARHRLGPCSGASGQGRNNVKWWLAVCRK